MEIDEVLRVRELLDAGPKPQALAGLWERMALAKNAPLYRKFTPMSPRCEIPAFRPENRERPAPIDFAKADMPPPVEPKRPEPRAIRLKPTPFSLEEEIRHD